MATNKDNPMIGIADWLSNQARLDEAQTVLDTVHKSKKSTDKDKKNADKLSSEIKKKNREKIASEVKKSVRMRKVKDLKPHPSLEEMTLTKSNDYNRIKKDIDNRGVQIPLVVDSDDKVVCGITRWKACSELGIEEVPTFDAKFDLYQDMLEYAVKDNVMRRQIPVDERVALMARLLKEKDIVMPGRPPEVKGTKREQEAIVKKATKAIAKPVEKAKKVKEPPKVIHSSYSCTFGKDGNRDREFSSKISDEVKKQIELLQHKGKVLNISITYEVCDAKAEEEGG